MFLKLWHYSSDTLSVVGSGGSAIGVRRVGSRPPGAWLVVRSWRRSSSSRHTGTSSCRSGFGGELAGWICRRRLAGSGGTRRASLLRDKNTFRTWKYTVDMLDSLLHTGLIWQLWLVCRSRSQSWRWFMSLWFGETGNLSVMFSLSLGFLGLDSHVKVGISW